MRTDDELSFAMDDLLNGLSLNVSNHALTPSALPNITFSLLGQLLQTRSPGGGTAPATSGTDSHEQWTVFCTVFVVMFLIEVYVFNRSKTALGNAFCTLFWFGCACSFCFYIYTVRGEDDAVNWFTGYVLEWLLSVDNLFVFQRIFICMGTPESQRQTALLWGILGAIFFRLVLFMCSQQLLNSCWWMHYLFGSFLIYTGIQAMRHQEDEPESDTPLFTCIAKRLPYVDKYHPDGAYFFMKVPEQGVADEGERTVWKATRLFLVVVCLELTDFIFAIDAVCVIIAQIPSVYLAFTACVFSMIGVRSLYDVADKLTRYFWLVSYGCLSF